MEVLLTAATLTTGLAAGLFYAYSISVMPALCGADAAVFVQVMQRIKTMCRPEPGGPPPGPPTG
jgi:uncharacterized membrane protein